MSGQRPDTEKVTRPRARTALPHSASWDLDSSRALRAILKPLAAYGGIVAGQPKIVCVHTLGIGARIAAEVLGLA